MPSVDDRKKMTILRMRLERERNKPNPNLAKIDEMMREYKRLSALPNPGNLLAQLKKGIRGHIKLSKGRLIIKT